MLKTVKEKLDAGQEIFRRPVIAILVEEAERNAVRLAAAEALLKRLEWAVVYGVAPFCPCCKSLEGVQDHRDDCELASFLKGNGRDMAPPHTVTERRE